jgi:hypothetical protein
MKKFAMLLGVVLSLSVFGFGQYRTYTAWKTITNTDLEAYKQKRLAAEKDYKENYEKMGFPSPEELDRQRDADMAVRMDLASQLRQARLEKERNDIESARVIVEAERVAVEREAAQQAAEARESYSYGGYGGYGAGYGYSSPYGVYGNIGIYPRNGRRYGNYPVPMVRITPYGVFSAGQQYPPFMSPYSPYPFFPRRNGGTRFFWNGGVYRGTLGNPKK